VYESSSSGGVKYSGYFKNNQPEGEGELIFTNGASFKVYLLFFQIRRLKLFSG